MQDGRWLEDRLMMWASHRMQGCLSQRYVKRYCTAWKGAEVPRFQQFSSPIWPCNFRATFEGAVPIREEIPPPSKERRVPKTEELGTPGHHPEVPEQRWESR